MARCASVHPNLWAAFAKWLVVDTAIGNIIGRDIHRIFEGEVVN